MPKKTKIIISMLVGFLIIGLFIGMAVFAFIYFRDREEGETIIDFISDEEADGFDEDDLDEDDSLEDEEILSSPVTQGWKLEGLCIENSENFWDPEIIELNDGSFRMYYEDHGESESNIKSITGWSIDDVGGIFTTSPIPVGRRQDNVAEDVYGIFLIAVQNIFATLR